MTSDWHIAEGAWRHKGVLGDAKYALEQVVDFCVENQVPLLAAGDLYDTDDPDPESVKFVHRQCDRLQAADLMLLFVQGQHERHRCGGTWLGTHPWPTHLGDGRTVSVPIGETGVCVNTQGFDWVPASEIPNLLSKVRDDGDLLMLHQVAKELMGSTTGGQCEISLTDVPGEYTILIGDYHVSVEKQVGKHRVYSPGSLALQEVDADPCKSFWLLEGDVDSEEILSARRIPLKGRPTGHYLIEDMDSLDQFLAEKPWASLFGGDDIPEHIRKPIVSVTFRDDLAGVRRRLIEALEREVHYFPKPVDYSRQVKVGSEPVRGASGLVEALDSTVPAESPVHGLLKGMFLTPARDLAVELKAARARFMEMWSGDHLPRGREE